MSVHDLMLEHLTRMPEQVKRVLLEVILAEQEQIDLDRPRVRERIKEVIEREALRAGDGE